MADDDLDLGVFESSSDEFTVRAAMVIDEKGFSAPGLVFGGVPDDDILLEFLLALECGSVAAGGNAYCVLPTPQHMWVFLSMYGRYMLELGSTAPAVALSINDLFAARWIHDGGSLFGLRKQNKKTAKDLAFITESHDLELVRTKQPIAREKSTTVNLQDGRVAVRVDGGKSNTHFLRYANPHFANVIRVTLATSMGTNTALLTPRISKRERLQIHRLCTQAGLTLSYHQTPGKRKREDPRGEM